MPEDPAEFAAFMSDRFTLDKVGISRQDLSLLRNFYFACISFVDYQISRIIDTLKARGLYDNTIIFFSSDHGEMLGDFGTMGKRSMLDGALRIPFMLRVPGQAAARRSDVCSLVDVAPTLLSLAGIEYRGEHFDGIDLFSDARHSEVYSQFSTGKKGAYTVSSNHDKLVYHAFEDRCYYFDRMPEDTNRYDASNPRAARPAGAVHAGGLLHRRRRKRGLLLRQEQVPLRPEARRPSGTPRRRACKNARGVRDRYLRCIWISPQKGTI